MTSLPLTPTILLTILFSPLVAFVIQILIGKRLFSGSVGGSAHGHEPHAPSAWGAIIPILGILLPLALVAIYIVPCLFKPTEPYFLPQGGAIWMDFGKRQLRIGLMVDNTSKALVLMVTLVCSMIHIFAAAYMKQRDGEPEPRYTRFFAYLSLFTFAMILLSLSDNLLTLFIGWELMGLCSYLLIGFYYEKKSANDAAVKAFMTTRVGDVLLFLAMVILWTTIGSLRLPDIHQGIADGRLAGGLLMATGILALAGAIGKSAQFPLHTWLPDAMEGPTPVSALIHAATMVAAGVYLAARFFQIGALDNSALLFIAYIGGFTAIFAASIAFVQTDIKKVLAYSTISQLGAMMLAVGVQNYTASLFHLLTHAFFKACLFLGSGSVIHALHEAFHHVHFHADAQDMRNMGGLRKRMPWTYRTFLISTLAISGVPLTSGFLSKDAILAGSLAFAMKHPEHAVLAVAGFGAALMTAFYMFRLVFLTFFGKGGELADDTHREKVIEAHDHVRESPVIMTAPLVVLAAFSLFLFWSLSRPFNPGWIEGIVVKEDVWMARTSGVVGPEVGKPEPTTPNSHEPTHAEPGDHTAHNIAVVLSLIVAGLGILLAALFYPLGLFSSARYARTRFARVLERKYGFDEFYDLAFVRNLHRVHRFSAAVDNRVVDGIVNGVGRVVGSGRYSFTWLSGAIDRYLVDGAVNGVAWALKGFGATLRRAQTGMIQSYLLVVFTGLVALAFILAVALR